MNKNTKVKHSFFFVLFFLLMGMLSQAQISLSTGAKTEPADTATKPVVPRTAIKPYNKVITKDFKSKWGLFAVHQNQDKIYFEIPDSLLNMDIMVINRLLRSAAGHGMYSGEQLDEKTIFFEKAKDSTIKIRYNLVVTEADPSSKIYKAVEKSSNNPIVGSFPIMAYGKHSTVIDMSKYLKEKNFINSISPQTALAQNATVTGMKDFSIESIRVYPINVEIAISKTMESKSKILPAGTPATIETNTSFIALPKVPMQRRFFDQRVGYFADMYYEFADEQQKAETRNFIVRWRLEPKPQDMAKWKKGELVEPAKPIVIYIDPATPKQWVPFLIAGVNDWQKAFEKAGFKNAIIGKQWPENDTSMHMEDARYSFINYLPSEVANAYGPNVHDPRSGEIIQTHIGWYHNVMELLHNWYMVQASAVDPEARKAKFDDKLMGELIRFVSSHEVGHTLGLRHNFGSSSCTPVEKLRDKKYLEKHGHTASIMDYARFNYVAQPEDNIPQELLFPRIGEYDDWAIEWGYKFINAPDAEADKKIVNSWIDKRIKENPRLWFGDGETRKFDPQCQTEDLGDNAMKASIYGIKNLKRIVPNLPEWTFEADKLNQGLGNMYKQVKDQYTRYLMHVLKNIGGVTLTERSEAEGGTLYQVVPKEKQLEAMAFFNSELFNTPLWLLDPKVINRVSLPEGPNVAEDLQVRIINTLLDKDFLLKILANQSQFGSDALSVDELVSTLHGQIWNSIKDKKVKLDIYQRNMQKAYLGSLTDFLIVRDGKYTETDMATTLRTELVLLKKEIDDAISKTADNATSFHLVDLQNRIKTALDPRSGG